MEDWRNGSAWDFGSRRFGSIPKSSANYYITRKDKAMNNVFDLMGMEVDDENYEAPNAELNLRCIPVGGEFVANGIKFIRLGFEQGGILCVTKDSMFRCKFNEGDDNNFKNSIILQKIRNEFLPRMEGIELLPYEMNLMAGNGETDYGSCVENAGLLTLDLYRKYHYQVPTSGGDQWLCTPFSCMRDYPYVQYVYSSGYVSSNFASYTSRCRPACIFAI